MKNEIIFYQPNGMVNHLEIKLNDDTVWLNRQQLAILFDRNIKTIGKHISNRFLIPFLYLRLITSVSI